VRGARAGRRGRCEARAGWRHEARGAGRTWRKAGLVRPCKARGAEAHGARWVRPVCPDRRPNRSITCTIIRTFSKTNQPFFLTVFSKDPFRIFETPLILIAYNPIT
jgi:hypothetical protein